MKGWGVWFLKWKGCFNKKSGARVEFSPHSTVISFYENTKFSSTEWNGKKNWLIYGRPTNYQTVPITGQFNVSGTVILFLQPNRRFNPNKLNAVGKVRMSVTDIRSGLHLIMSIFTPKSKSLLWLIFLLTKSRCNSTLRPIHADKNILSFMIFRPQLITFTILIRFPIIYLRHPTSQVICALCRNPMK